MTDYQLHTRLKGTIALTKRFHAQPELQRDQSLYKFLWVQRGTLHIEVDHLPITLQADDLMALTPLHHIQFNAIEGEYITFLFNSNFYCIFGHDDEVSCNGLLFNGADNLTPMHLSSAEAASLGETLRLLDDESTMSDNLQEEMLRIILKRFIISCTRIARERRHITAQREKGFDIVRQYYILVDSHFRQKRQVADYASMLCRSPKTLSNLFATYGLPSPLKVIHDRVEAEARRLLLYSSKSAKQIGEILGFDDMAAFSRFFRNTTGESISDFRNRTRREK